MDKTGQSLLKLLFNEGETVCVSDNKFGFHSIPLESALEEEVSLILPKEGASIRKCPSSNLTLVALNPIQGFRRDENVTAFRSFLIEMDSGSVKDQLGTLAYLKMPFSVQVYSGNKSVHTAIVLDKDLPDEKTYRTIAEWILSIVPLADKMCKNPSRSIRIPGAYREPGKKQRLLKMGKRVSLKELMNWLNQYEHLRPRAKEKRIVPEGEADYSRLSPWARSMLTKGIVFRNGRNRTWFGLATDLAMAGFSEEQMIEVLGKHFQEERDFKEKEWLTTVRSAFKKVSEGK